MPWAVAAALFATLALTLALVHFRETPAHPQLVRFTLQPPEGARFGNIVVSPDGHRIAFTVTDSTAKAQLWVRSLDSLVAQPVAGTDDANHPFWSPDNRFIGFFAQGKLNIINASGGLPQMICNAPQGRGGTWSRQGIIVFAPSTGDAIYQVPAAGGEAKPATSFNVDHQESSHRWPSFLPDGRHFLYFARSGQREHTGIYLASLDSKEARLLVRADSGPAFVSHYADGPSGLDYVLYIRESTLLAQPFETRGLQVIGDAVTVAERVGTDPLVTRAHFSISENGVLVYDSSAGGSNTELLWFNRAGKRVGSVGPPGAYFTFALSPDDMRVATDRVDPQGGTLDIWLFELARGYSSRFTFHPGPSAFPVWSPDGSRAAFGASREGPMDIYLKVSSGASQEELLLKSHSIKVPTDWSADGKYLLYSENSPITRWDLWALPVLQSDSGNRKPVSLLRTGFDEWYAQFSPDGNWIAYQSNESGKDEVYVRPFAPEAAAVSGKWQISTNGGIEPKWRRDGKELF